MVDEGVEDRDFVTEIKMSTEKLEVARSLADEVWEDHKKLIKEAYASGLSYQAIADIMGVTKARVWQLVTGKRPGAKKAEA